MGDLKVTRWTFVPPDEITIDGKPYTIVEALELMMRLQSLIDEHNRAMDADCEKCRPLMQCDKYYGDDEMCSACARHYKIEG